MKHTGLTVQEAARETNKPSNQLDNNESPIKLESARSNATHVTNTGLGKLTNRLTQNEPQ